MLKQWECEEEEKKKERKSDKGEEGGTAGKEEICDFHHLLVRMLRWCECVCERLRQRAP